MEAFNYNVFPPDIRSNCILERYNKIIKTELGSKRNCNWVIFLNFINKELDRLNEIKNYPKMKILMCFIKVSKLNSGLKNL